MADFNHLFPSAEQFDTMNALLALIAANREGGMEVSSWKSIAQIVKMGLAPSTFPVGYEFTTHDSNEDTTIVWVVRGHDQHLAANKNYKHTMTLETKYVYSNSAGAYKGMAFDEAEALYYAESGLAAGTYHFTLLSGYDTGYGGGKTLMFTLTKPLPAGGQITFPWEYAKQATDIKIRTYPSADSTQAIESDITVTEGTDGTMLGTADGKTANMNHTHRIRHGSNNYAQSAVRQWLNSDAEAGSVWKPTNRFDRAPSWATKYNGFMHGLPAEFLEVVQPAIIPCHTNSIYEVESLDGTEFTADQTYNIEDKFFLLSQPEIYGSGEDGELLPYYEGFTNAEKIKRDAAGTARHCRLRSPMPTDAARTRILGGTTGKLDNTPANQTIAVAPACIIA